MSFYCALNPLVVNLQYDNLFKKTLRIKVKFEQPSISSFKRNHLGENQSTAQFFLSLFHLFYGANHLGEKKRESTALFQLRPHEAIER